MCVVLFKLHRMITLIRIITGIKMARNVLYKMHCTLKIHDMLNPSSIMLLAFRAIVSYLLILNPLKIF